MNRDFDYVKTKATMQIILDKAEELKQCLEKCDSIFQENVGVAGRWSGPRATDFKQKWERAASEFDEFVKMIVKYSLKAQESYKVHQGFDQTQNILH